MVKTSPAKGSGGKGKGGGKGGGGKPVSMIDKPLGTPKGSFEFTLVADGLYIEHKVCL